jgi:predicted Zn-ribbon and HTH transcriptional regulator
VVWKDLIAKAEAERVVLYKHLDGKALFTAMLRLYAALHREMRDTVLPAQQKSTEEFREQRRRKRNPSDEQAKKSKTTMPAPVDKPQPQGEVKTKNFFAPLRTAEMEVEHAPVENTSDDPENEPQQPAANKAGRPPPIVLTTATILMQLQKRIKDIVTGKFEFRNTRSGTRIVTKVMVDFITIRKHLENNNLFYFTFLPKSEKPIKVVVRHLPPNTPAQDISDGLVDLGFDIINVKQMSAGRRSRSEGSASRILPLLLITLPRTEKSKEIFQLTDLCHIMIRVEAYRAQSGLTQCHNCQQFGHVWANCKQPSRCLWCGGCHLHKECPEKENAASAPACCNCQMAEGEKPHPANCRGCRHAREELQRRKAQRAPKTATGWVFSSNLTTPGVSFAAALRGSAAQQQQQPPPEADPPAGGNLSAPTSGRPQNAGQSVRAPTVSSHPLDKMLRVVTAVQQIMTEFNGAVSEEDKIVAITKTVLNLMKQDGH